MTVLVACPYCRTPVIGVKVRTWVTAGIHDYAEPADFGGFRCLGSDLLGTVQR